MTTTKNQGKTTTFKLSEQVENELFKRGYSFLFNINDFISYKNQVKNAFNKVQSITEMFIQDNQNSKSDYDAYIF